MIVEIRADGRTVGDDEMAGLLNRPANAAGRLEIVTDSICSLAAAALGQTVEALEQSRQHHVAIAEHLTCRGSSRRWSF